MARSEVLKRANTDVAGGNAGEHSAGCGFFSRDDFSGENRGERAGGRHTECVHGLADEVFAEDGTKGGFTIAAT